MSHHQDYAELSRAAETGQLLPAPGTPVLRGPEAAAAARAALLAATGADTLDEATRVAIGRPSLDRAGQGRSPVVRARVPQALKDRVHQLAAAQHRAESEIVRDALTAYVQNY